MPASFFIIASYNAGAVGVNDPQPLSIIHYQFLSRSSSRDRTRTSKNPLDFRSNRSYHPSELTLKLLLPNKQSPPPMPLRVTFAEQQTGIVTTLFGERSLEPANQIKAADMHEAFLICSEYLENHPDHEAWIGSSVTSHRLTKPIVGGFDSWISRYRSDRSLGHVKLGLTYGDIVSMLGWPDDCSKQLKKSPLSVILRYQPKDVDFHFDDGGRLYLVLQDDCDDPLTILTTS